MRHSMCAIVERPGVDAAIREVQSKVVALVSDNNLAVHMSRGKEQKHRAVLFSVRASLRNATNSNCIVLA